MQLYICPAHIGSEGNEIALYDYDSKLYKVKNTLFMINEECFHQDLTMTNKWCRTDHISINANIIHCTLYLSSPWLRAYS